MRTAAGIAGTVMSAVLICCWLPSISNCSVAPSLRTSIVTGGYASGGRRYASFLRFPQRRVSGLCPWWHRPVSRDWAQTYRCCHLPVRRWLSQRCSACVPVPHSEAHCPAVGRALAYWSYRHRHIWPETYPSYHVCSSLPHGSAAHAVWRCR